MSISDTSAKALEIQRQIHRSFSGEQRILIALEMSLFARELARERILSEHPDWDEWQVKRELLRIAFLPQPLPAGLQ
jgi:Rv0078B-related antitoxin